MSNTYKSKSRPMLRALGITETDILGVIDDDTESTLSERDSGFEKLLELTPTLSTMTACGNIGGSVDIHTLIETVDIIPYRVLRDGILRVEGYARHSPKKWVHRGICRKYLIRKNPGKGPFKNAATFYIRIYDSDMDEYKEPSIKVFHNGGFQVTGVRTPSQMDYVIHILVDAIKKTRGGFTEEDAPFSSRAFREVCMMNADVCTGYTLSRTAIQKTLTTHSSLRSTYESTAYQGVNIKFYWNAGRHAKGDCQNGVCPCDEQCVSSGKKSSIRKTATNVKTKCTKVTIAPFQTGKIIITGAKHEAQIRDASKWILRFIVDHSDEIIGPPVVPSSRPSIPDPLRKSYPFIMPVEKEAVLHSYMV